MSFTKSSCLHSYCYLWHCILDYCCFHFDVKPQSWDRERLNIHLIFLRGWGSTVQLGQAEYCYGEDLRRKQKSWLMCNNESTWHEEESSMTLIVDDPWSPGNTDVDFHQQLLMKMRYLTPINVQLENSHWSFCVDFLRKCSRQKNSRGCKIFVSCPGYLSRGLAQITYVLKVYQSELHTHTQMCVCLAWLFERTTLTSGGQQLRDWGRTMRRRGGTRRSLVWACRAGAQFSGAVGPRGPFQGEPCGEGNCCLRVHSGLGAHSWKGQGVGAGGRLGAQPGGGGGEEGRVGVRLRGVAGSSRGGDDGERGLSEAVRGRMCVPQGLWEAWALLLGSGPRVLRWWLGWQPRDRDQTMRRRRRCWQRFGQAQVGRWSAEPQGWWPGNTSLCVLWACWRSGSAGHTPRRDRASPRCGCGGGASCWAGWWSSSHKSHRWKASLLHRFTNKSRMCEEDMQYQSKRLQRHRENMMHQSQILCCEKGWLQNWLKLFEWQS